MHAEDSIPFGRLHLDERRRLLEANLDLWPCRQGCFRLSDGKSLRLLALDAVALELGRLGLRPPDRRRVVRRAERLWTERTLIAAR